jgi:hypothetical protein
MRRDDVLRFLKQHPSSSHVDPAEIVERCERAVRRHANEDAWLAAKRYAERRRQQFESEGWGNHASEAFVAEEVCHQIAYELRSREPRFEIDDALHLAGGPVHDAVDAEGWEALVGWILELAREEEHATWREIVRFTDRRGRELVREKHLSHDCDLEHAPHYPEAAARVAAALAHDYSVHAHPR